MVECADGTLYTGIATNAVRRIKEHNSDDRLASRYTRSRRPVTLVYVEFCAGRAAATRREYAIKRLTRREKQSLIKSRQAE